MGHGSGFDTYNGGLGGGGAPSHQGALNTGGGGGAVYSSNEFYTKGGSGICIIRLPTGQFVDVNESSSS